MSDTEQTQLLSEIVELLKRQASLQEKEALAMDEHRKWTRDAQQIAQETFRATTTRNRYEIRLWFAFLGVIAILGMVTLAMNLEFVMERAIKTLNLPEFVPPKDQPTSDR